MCSDISGSESVLYQVLGCSVLLVVEVPDIREFFPEPLYSVTTPAIGVN